MSLGFFSGIVALASWDLFVSISWLNLEFLGALAQDNLESSKECHGWIHYAYLTVFSDLLLIISPILVYRFVLQTGERTSLKPFGYDEWEDTKQDGRYIDLVKAVLGLDVLQRLQRPLLLLNFVSAAALFYDELAVPGGRGMDRPSRERTELRNRTPDAPDPTLLNSGAPDLTLPVEPFSIGFVALGLLLAFRASQSRMRFARVRDLWDDILEISRTPVEREQFMELARWIPAFPAALMCHLRQSDARSLRSQLRKSRGPDHEAHEVPEIGGLTEVEIAEVLNRPAGISAPLFVLHRLTAITTRLKLKEDDRMFISSSLSRLSNILGSCEDLQMPMPVAYVEQTTRFLFLYLILLPLGLLQELGEPFLALPIEKICETTARDSQALRDDWDRLRMGGSILALGEASDLANPLRHMSNTQGTPSSRPRRSWLKRWSRRRRRFAVQFGWATREPGGDGPERSRGLQGLAWASTVVEETEETEETESIKAGVAPPAATESHDILDSIIRVGLQPDLLLRLRKPLTFLNFISAAVFIFHFYFLPGGSLVLPIEPFVACTFFLGILLAHRVTRATERFQRGQQAWSDLVNVTRTAVDIVFP
eukprot:g16586.t1